MKCPVVSMLILILTVETECSSENRFFISAPNVFHVGVNEKVFVQMGEPHLNSPITLHLEHESTRTVVSRKEIVFCNDERDIKTAQLMINKEIMSRFQPPKHQPPYLLLVAESPSFPGRKSTKVLVSKHRGYIFIQTNQPIYNPTQKVLPSFEVNINMKQSYILMNEEEIVLTISAMYTNGDNVKGAYHFKFGVVDKVGPRGQIIKPVFIDGLELTGSVTADGLQERKIIKPASSPRDTYLYMSFTNKMYSVNDLLAVTYNTVNGPSDGFIYYMVRSRGILIKDGSLRIGSSVKNNLLITPDMVPSFRLIGYFYNQHGDIIADSVWVDVRDECEIKVKVEQKGLSEPGRPSVLNFDLHGQRAKVALLAVDKAFYALNTDNKLTAKQVFSSMQSYDLGCSYGGGSNPASVLTDAGLSFVTQSESDWRRDFRCDSRSARQRRSVDLQQEMITLKSNFSDEKLQECCGHGFALIPMTLTCQERAKRVSLVRKNLVCAEAFLKCCLEGMRLRQKKMREDAKRGFGRTASEIDIEEFFLDTASQYIRRFFPPSFAFTEFEVNGKHRYTLTLPDSITTWEIQVITLSAASGFCVVEPSDVKAVKRTFVSLRLPYSVRKYEQISISPVIYNYGFDRLEVAVHMEQTEGLCSPGSATTTAYVNITVEPESSQFVSFSAVPMVTGSIPIKIRLYDMVNEIGIDAVEKTLNVWEEGFQKRVEETRVIQLDGKSTKTFNIDGTLPDEVIPGSSTNIFISAEENGFHLQAKNLLNPKKVAGLIVLPTGCLEQTMVRLAPTASALRYLDLSEQWFNLPAGARDEALDKITQGYTRILSYKKGDGSYGAWYSVPSSNWVTALVVKVLSLVAQRQTGALGQQGQITSVVPAEEIMHSVSYLTSVQNTDGSFTDPHPVLHRQVLDTIMALEALAEYELKRSVSPQTNLIAEFTVPTKRDIVKLTVGNKEKVEADLKKLAGNNIVMQLSGTGDIKLKIVKAFHLLDPKDDCDKLSISVSLEGKVEYTAKVIETYEYYDDYDNNEEKESQVPQSAVEGINTPTRSRRDVDNAVNSDETVTYMVCVSHSLNNNLTGMAIADITLLSGFEAVIEDLDRLYEPEECISFDAIQRVPIGLLQPAPAVFYDYYEPQRKCTVFYSAPQRSKVVSTLCSEDVCQCAERPCHKLKMTFKSERSGRVTKNDRVQHACFFPTVDYAYIVEVLSVSTRSNFEIYNTTVTEVLRSRRLFINIITVICMPDGDMLVNENSARVFAKRRQCKGELHLGKPYLIMGKDGSTTDSNGVMQYLLESNTWVEQKPSEEECKKSAHQAACRGFSAFINEYKLDGCKQ
ncbi:hypothetical protein F2P81_001832 [Scophthalmus maximus]|uniref:Complement C4-like n=1 Tax=Scophthalmus maximus TaxID=52904 RepID=A0A6A4TH79_SCOMX|nr:hypothetical protein F2P81_001832 [Scophthalmus maximus]